MSHAFLDVNDSHRDADVRQALGPLTEIADQHNVAILLIAHLNKAVGRDARERVSGSGAIVNAVRVAYLVHEDGKDSRVLVPFKTNLSPEKKSLMYIIEGKPWNESGDEVGYVKWIGETTRDATTILNANNGTQMPAPQLEEASTVHTGFPGKSLMIIKKRSTTTLKAGLLPEFLIKN